MLNAITIPTKLEVFLLLFLGLTLLEGEQRLGVGVWCASHIDIIMHLHCLVLCLNKRYDGYLCAYVQE